MLAAPALCLFYESFNDIWHRRAHLHPRPLQTLFRRTRLPHHISQLRFPAPALPTDILPGIRSPIRNSHHRSSSPTTDLFSENRFRTFRREVFLGVNFLSPLCPF